MRRRSFGQRLAHQPETGGQGYSLLEALDTSSNRGDIRQKSMYARTIAVALGLTLIVAACSSEAATTDDSREAVTTTTAGSANTTAESADTKASDEAATTAPSPDTTTARDDTGGILDFAFDAVPVGMWRVETLGTPFDIHIEGDWFVQPNESGWTVFTAPGSSGPGDRDVVFIRPTALSDPTDLSASGETWPVDDIQGWLEAIVDGVVVAEPVGAEVGGAEGIVFEVELAVGSDRVEFVENSDVSGKAFDPGHRYIVYWLNQGDHEPIAIIVGAHSPDIDDWAPSAGSLLANVTFDEPAPHPSG